MPLLLIMGIFTLHTLLNITETGNAPSSTENETARILQEMTGKSRKECRKILRQYKGNWLQR